MTWLLLLLSSIPIHLLFNSSIYTTTFQSQEWNVTIATDYFTQNGMENRTYWLPGASLAVPRTSSPVQNLTIGFGFPSRGNLAAVVNEDYWDSANYDIRQEINTTARSCIEWTYLSPADCMEEYRPYKYHSKYNNVVIIVRPNDSGSRGWRRDEVFEFSSESNLSEVWDSKIPFDGINSLWFWTPCSIFEDFSSDTSNADSKKYFHSCASLFGLNTVRLSVKAGLRGVTTLSFTQDGTVDNTTAGELPESLLALLKANSTAEELSQGYLALPGARNLEIDHCLAQPVTCQVRLANALLFTVIICILVKVVTCTVVWTKLSSASLVTPGDAIASFISQPDATTSGLGTLRLSDAQSLECKPRSASMEDRNLSFNIRPRRWTETTHWLCSSVPRDIWVQVYYPVFLGMTAVSAGLYLSLTNSQYMNFGQSQDFTPLRFFNEKLSYLSTLILLNLPQVILSCVYLAINMLYTQLQIEQEWNSYGRGYSPLRVSYPAGEQRSTYRLQLPFKYSIPILAGSVLLHWLASQCIFLLIVEGSARTDLYGDMSNEDLAKSMGVSPGATIAIGYSTLGIIVFLAVSFVSALLPLLFWLRRLKNDMVVGATNTLVISAACHVYRPSQRTTGERVPCGLGEKHTLIKLLVQGNDPYQDAVQATDCKEYLAQVAKGRVRWGAVQLPRHLAEKIEVHDEPVMHLGFGTEEHDVQAPQTGTLYA